MKLEANKDVCAKNYDGLGQYTLVQEGCTESYHSRSACIAWRHSLLHASILQFEILTHPPLTRSQLVVLKIIRYSCNDESKKIFDIPEVFLQRGERMPSRVSTSLNIGKILAFYK